MKSASHPTSMLRACLAFQRIIGTLPVPLTITACTTAVDFSSAPAERTELPESEVQRLTSYFESQRGARYMEKNPQTFRNSVGWEGCPLVKCRHSVKDPVDGRINTAEIINAEPEKLRAGWVSTCIEVKDSARSVDVDRLSRCIIDASGAQFPVAGIVFEAMNNAPRQKVYCFRAGVTVRWPECAMQPPSSPTTPRCSLHEIPRRRSSMYSNSRGSRAPSARNIEPQAAWRTLKGPLGCAFVRKLYQQASNSDRNELMIAWEGESMNSCFTASPDPSQ